VSGNGIENPRSEYQYDARARDHPNVDEKLNKILLIPLPDAIVDPRAMMIHPTNAAFADATVMSAWRTIRFTFRAQRPSIGTLGINQILVAQIDGSV